MFRNPDFKIDKKAEDFKLRNPSGVVAREARNNRDIDSDREEEDGDEDVGDEDVGGGGSGFSRVRESNSDANGFRGRKVRARLSIIDLRGADC